MKPKDDRSEGAKDPKDTPVDREDRSFDVERGRTGVEGSGATADDVEDESDPDEEERLDEGLEETFPASDPVSTKHIT